MSTSSKPHTAGGREQALVPDTPVQSLAVLDQAIGDVAAGRVSDDEIAAFAGW